MHVVITGASGLVGGALVNQLRQRGTSVIAVLAQSPSAHGALGRQLDRLGRPHRRRLRRGMESFTWPAKGSSTSAGTRLAKPPCATAGSTPRGRSCKRSRRLAKSPPCWSAPRRSATTATRSSANRPNRRPAGDDFLAPTLRRLGGGIPECRRAHRQRALRHHHGQRGRRSPAPALPVQARTRRADRDSAAPGGVGSTSTMPSARSSTRSNRTTSKARSI